MNLIMMVMTWMMRLTRAGSRRGLLVPGRVEVQARHWSHKHAFENKVVQWELEIGNAGGIPEVLLEPL